MRSNNKLFYPVSIVLCICLVCLGIRYYNSDDVKFNRYFDKITSIELEEVMAIDVHLSKDNKSIRFYIDNEKAFLMLDLLHEMKFLKQVSSNDENELDYTYGIWNAIETSESMFAIRLEVNQANYNIRITEINIDRNRNRQIETNKYFKANDKSAALLRELLNEVVAGEPESSPRPRKDFTAEDLGINYNRFEPLGNYISKTLFKYDPKIVKGDPDKLGEPYLVQGKYDLNSDGAADIIEVFFKALSAAYCRETDKLSRIWVNDSEIEAFFHNPRGVFVIDLNEDNRFKELVVFDDGPSGDPGINLYRYNGNKIIEFGGISGVIGETVEERPDAVEDKDSIVSGGPYYGIIKADGRGRILSPSDIVEFLFPEIILGIREIKEEKIEHTKLDYRNMLFQEYEIKEDFQTYFKETENDTELFSSPSWDENRIISFNRGEKIYLKDFEAQDARYLVELENGKRGIMYFWTGD